MQKTAGKQEQRGHGQRRQKTRDRILQTAREMFNEQGEANVTLAQIGERIGISEGNVWYYFHTKNDLVLALFNELQMHVKENQQRDLGDLRQVSHLENILTRGFHLMWEYRFLFRDHINWLADQPEVREQLTALLTQGHSFIERVVAHLQEFELLDIQQNEIPILATNMWIINRYWIDYCQLRCERQQITEQDVQEGIQQVRSLIIPYLTPRGRQVLNRRNDTSSPGQ